MANQKLSINIIVKNGGTAIEDCLRSACNVADEVIVVDTGSVDGTIDRVKQMHDVTLYCIEWENSFSAARNYALDRSTGEWVLYLDADEILQADRETLNTMMENEEAEGYWIVVESFLAPDLSQSKLHHNLRMFRNRPDYRFEGRIHEQILKSILRNSSREVLKESNVVIQHFGYLPEQVAIHAKINRNIQLLELSLTEEPNTPFYMYHLGVEHSRLENYEKSSQFLLRCLQNEHPKASYLPSAYYLLITNTMNQKNFAEAEKKIMQTIEAYPDYTDLYFLLGLVYSEQFLYREALEAFYKAIEIGEAPRKYISTKGTGGYLSHLKVGEIYKQLGHRKEAVERFFYVIQLAPTFRPAYQLFAACLDESSYDEREVKGMFKELASLPQSSPLYIAESLCHIGYYESAIEYLHQLDSEDYYVKSIKNEYLMQTGQCLDAIRLQKQILHELPHGHPHEDTWMIDHVICFWSEQLPIPYSILKRIENHEQINWLLSVVLLLEGASGEKPIHLSTEQFSVLIKRLLHYGFAEVAHTITTKLDVSYLLLLAKLLYTEGYQDRAAKAFLDLLELHHFDEEAYFYLGEILFDRNQYYYASKQFEIILQTNPNHWRARTGAALSYLAEGYNWISESQEYYAGVEFLQEQLKEINVAVEEMQQTNWHTRWTRRQRRNRER